MDYIEKQHQRASVGRLTRWPLRRAWASAMQQRGASLNAVSEWLGHGGLGVTERYIRVIETDGHRFLPR